MNTTTKTVTGAVAYVIHINTIYRYEPRLYIRNMPEGLKAYQLKNILDEAGYQFKDFGIQSANHDIYSGLKDSHYSIRTGFMKAKELGIEVIEYDELVLKAKESQNIN